MTENLSEKSEPAPKARKKSGPSPTQHTLKALKEAGHICQVTEKWNPFAKIRQDLFGCIDLVYCDVRRGAIVGVQATSDSNRSARIAKSAAEPRLKFWLKCGGKFEVWTWGKKGDRGKRKLWTRTVVELVLDDKNRIVPKGKEIDPDESWEDSIDDAEQHPVL